MPLTVQPKNVDPVLADVKKPGQRYDLHFHRPVVHLEHEPQRPDPKWTLLRRSLFIGILTVAVIVIGTGFLVASDIRTAKNLFAGRGDEIAQNFLLSLDALSRFDPGEAAVHLEQNRETFSVLEGFLDNRFGGKLFELVGAVVPPIDEARALVTKVSALNADFLALSETLGEVQTNGFRYFQSDGPKLLALLSRTQELIRTIRSETSAVKNSTTELHSVAPFFAMVDDALGDGYVKRSAELSSVERFLTGAIGFLSSATDRHLLLLFQNPAELRPGGGFIGSYADLVVRNGQLWSMKVSDIYDPDGQLDVNVVPPQALWTVTERWGARDANWFFDFPLSAKTVVNFLELSKIYSERDIRFDVAVAMNINVFRSVLSLVGPITLDEYKFTVTPENFLNEIQREVEAGKDRETGYPKRILRVLAPIVLERLGSLSAVDQTKLIDAFSAHLARKDLMFYSSEPELADFFAARGINGAVYDLPNNFWGNYLGVVDTNVASGKSDAFIDQSIEARIDVDTDGGALVDVAVTRTHRGNTQKDSWWRSTNQNYFQVFVNPNATLVSLSGNDTKAIAPQVDYSSSSFTVNPDLERIESSRLFSSTYDAWTGDAFGKTVFSTWWLLASGKTETLEMRYQVPTTPDFRLDVGKTYAFVFDRQSGVKTTLNITILAPLGYSWAETGTSVFTHAYDDPLSRETVALTLVKS
jgi:hypothetical protein